MEHLSKGTADLDSFAILGLERLIYIRPITVNGRRVHIIHAADGTPLSIITDREVALATIRQYEMDPVSVH